MLNTVCPAALPSPSPPPAARLAPLAAAPSAPVALPQAPTFPAPSLDPPSAFGTPGKLATVPPCAAVVTPVPESGCSPPLPFPSMGADSPAQGWWLTALPAEDKNCSCMECCLYIGTKWVLRPRARGPEGTSELALPCVRGGCRIQETVMRGSALGAAGPWLLSLEGSSLTAYSG